MKKPKLLWKYDSKTSEPFVNQDWPTAVYSNNQPAALILCEEGYSKAKATTGDHSPLRIRIADHSVKPFKWRISKRYYMKLTAAQKAVELMLVKYPNFIPEELK